MTEEVPQQLKTAAIVQLVSGLINWMVMSAVVYLGVGLILGLCTIWMGGLGGICGIVGCALVPIGIFEVVAGVMGLTNPRSGAAIMKIASYVEMAGLLFGGIPGAIAGFLVYRWLQEPDVVAYLEAPEASGSEG